jgi:tetratricopeptide (TPR) repeat protein
VRWTALKEASRYRISLNGPTPLRIDLKPEDVAFTDEGTARLIRRVCSLTWPAERADLVPGAAYFIEVQARRGIAGPWVGTEEAHRFEILEEKPAEGVHQRVEEIRRLAVDDFTRDLLTAGIYAQEGLFMDAIDFYARLVDVSDIPELKVTLGDLYQVVGLHRQAGASYQQVIEREPGSEARAAAELGLGRLYAVWNMHQRALEHFECARAMFIELGFPTEAEAVEKESAKSRRKVLD